MAWDWSVTSYRHFVFHARFGIFRTLLFPPGATGSCANGQGFPALRLSATPRALGLRKQSKASRGGRLGYAVWETEQGIARRPRRNAVFGRRRKAARVGR